MNDISDFIPVASYRELLELVDKSDEGTCLFELQGVPAGVIYESWDAGTPPKHSLLHRNNHYVATLQCYGGSVQFYNHSMGQPDNESYMEVLQQASLLESAAQQRKPARIRGQWVGEGQPCHADYVLLG